jgi:O-antigen/teichoic acid export membrane protein
MLAAFIFVARMLGKTSYGELGIIRSTVGMFGIFGGLGLGLTATKYVAELRERDPERAGRILGLSMRVALFSGTFLGILLFVSAPWLAANTLDAPHLAGALRIGAVLILLSAVNGAQTGALSGFEAFKTIALINFFIGFFRSQLSSVEHTLVACRGLCGLLLQV